MGKELWAIRMKKCKKPRRSFISSQIQRRLARFMEKVSIQENGCWEWIACLNSTGYGVFSLTGTLKIAAHRWSYAHHKGGIPEGLHIDHLCRNPACVNPEHLEAVTLAENTRRSWINRRNDDQNIERSEVL